MLCSQWDWETLPLENSGSLADLLSPVTALYFCRRGKKKSPNPKTVMGFKQKCGRNTLSKMALSFPFRLQLICRFLKFLLKILDAPNHEHLICKYYPLLNCFPSVLKFKFFESSPYYYLKYIFPCIHCFLLHFRCKESNSTSV